MIGERFFVTERTEEAPRSRREELDGWGVGDLGRGRSGVGDRSSEIGDRGARGALRAEL